MDSLNRAKKLIESARCLFEQEDLTGVAGLAYQAVEAAIIHLTNKMNGKISAAHGERRKRAEELLSLSKNALKDLWSARNIDFYGNERIDGGQKELDMQEIQDSLEKAEEIIFQIEKIVNKK